MNDAINIGFTLGLDSEIEVLMAQVRNYAQAGNPTFKIFSFEETLEQMKRVAERRNKIHDSYSKGKMPLHFLAGENRLTLATLFHKLPEQNRKETDFRRCAKIFTRHGGRSMREGFFEVKSDTRLYMDITAFLLAAELKILDKVEEMFAPIYVPSTLPLAITEERQKLTSHQIAEIDTHRGVRTLLEKNRFEIFSESIELSDEHKEKYEEVIKHIRADIVALILIAKDEESYVVEHLPITDKKANSYVLPGSLADSVINCRVIAESLHHFGHLEQIEFDTALDKLGTSGNKVIQEQIIVPLNTKLYLNDYMVNALEKAEILDKTCHHYQVFVDEGYIERIRADILAFDRDQETADWLQKAEKHLSERFAAGVYVGINVEDRETLEKIEKSDNVDVDVVTEILQLIPQTDACIWIDDRSVNFHSHSNGTLLITITDILDSLHQNNKLSDVEYFDLLLKLRAGNFRYIPLGSKEILRHLRASKIVEGQLIESDALSVLRRYSASCLLDSKYLQKPPMPKGSPNMFGEVNFALEMTGSVVNAIIAIWNEEDDSKDAEIRANWLLDNLYIGKQGTRHLLSSKNLEDNDSYEIGVDFSELLAKAIAMDINFTEKEENSKRKLYFDWINRRLFLPRFKANPNIVTSTANTLDNLFQQQQNQKLATDKESEWSSYINADLFIDLPQRIREHMKINDETLEWLGVSTEKYFTFGKSKFLTVDFLPTVEKAINGEPATISPLRSSKILQVKDNIDKDKNPTIDLIDENGDIFDRLEYGTLGVLFRDRTRIVEHLKTNKDWFDCENSVFEREVEEIASLADPFGRLESVNALRDKSIAIYYKNLQVKFNFLIQQGKKTSVDLDDLEGFPPSGLLRHYRLESNFKEGEKFTDKVLESIKILLKEEGVRKAIERISHLPYKIPNCVINRIKNITDEEISALFQYLVKTLKSPLCKMQLVDLILRLESKNKELLDIAKNLVEDVFDEEHGVADFELFKSILGFISEEFNYFSETKDWSQPVKLSMIWAHTGKLFNLLQLVFGNASGFCEWFRRLHQNSSNIFDEKNEYIYDCLNPQRINRTLFLTHAASDLWLKNKTKDLKALDIFEKVKNAIVLKDKVAQLELFRSSKLLVNSSDSIFSGDRAEVFSNFFETDDWGSFSETSFKDNVNQALDSLKNNQLDNHAWITLSIILGDLPIYEDFRSKFIALIKDLNFSSLLEQDAELAINALSFIISQSCILDDSLREKCESWLYLLAQNLSKTNISVKPKITKEMLDYGYRLLGMVFILSINEGDLQKSTDKFYQIMLTLLNIWEDFGAMSESTIINMNATLPLNQTQNLPKILLNIRASKLNNMLYE